MAAIKVHGFHASTATNMVRCCLNEKQVEYDFVLVDLLTGAHKKPQYLALNPFGVGQGLTSHILCIKCWASYVCQSQHGGGYISIERDSGDHLVFPVTSAGPTNRGPVWNLLLSTSPRAKTRSKSVYSGFCNPD